MTRNVVKISIFFSNEIEMYIKILDFFKGDGIIIGCMVLNAINWASREKMLLENEGISTMNVVGLEGLLGVVYTFFLVALLAIFPKYNSIVDDVNLAFLQMVCAYF